MKTNMGVTDKAVRITAAVILTALYFNGTLTGVLGVLALVVAAIFLLTSLIGFCPLYAILGLSTKKRDTELK